MQSVHLSARYASTRFRRRLVLRQRAELAAYIALAVAGTAGVDKHCMPVAQLSHLQATDAIQKSILMADRASRAQARSRFASFGIHCFIPIYFRLRLRSG